MDDSIELNNELQRTFYHGFLPHADIDPLLKEEGDFVIRKTDKDVRWNKQILHFVVNQDEMGYYYFETHKEKTMHDLINWHKTTGTPISAGSHAKLVNGVGRQPWLLEHDEIQLQRKLGEGAFGEVYLAQYVQMNKITDVAVKTMREEASRQARLKFMKEARIMRKFSHPNVVKIMGIMVYENPLMIVMELCPEGSMLSYLRKNVPVNSDLKLRFVTEASAGLAYLESKHCIHRDIAARNCLLSEQLEVKISDFGMSDERRIIHDENKCQVPMKWLAPETMQQRIFSSKTDVWSFGVLVWEVYADGKEPYPGLSNIQTRAKIVVQNYRMEMPKTAPLAISKLVYRCWKTEPSERPSFAEIYSKLKVLNRK
ncbi:Protein tyrosine kinase family protein [Brugia pahangi]